jgi:NAD(P)-dependent dehydrogenase (short-subunit alcohol dehydrogenase family)
VKVGVVTGAASGMGRACVERVGGLVDRVVAADLRRPEIAGAVCVACDVSRAEDVSSLAELVAAEGRFRALVHAAGLSPSMTDARRIVEVNLGGTVQLLDAFGPLVGQGTAAVCFASGAGYFPVETLGEDELTGLLGQPLSPCDVARVAALIADPALAYIWSKRGVQLATRRAAVGWAAHGGRVVSLSPGTIDTPMGRLESESMPIIREMVDQTPISRFGTADELAAVAAFLVSDEASFLTGVDVLVDGGARAAQLTAAGSIQV